MGAATFMTYAEGKSAREAFQAALRTAHHDYGNAGYTGTIAEKTEFQFVEPPDRVDFLDHKEIEAWIDEQISTIDYKNPPFWDDKWGPAACFKVGEEGFYFFGWASS